MLVPGIRDDHPVVVGRQGRPLRDPDFEPVPESWLADRRAGDRIDERDRDSRNPGEAGHPVEAEVTVGGRTR